MCFNEFCECTGDLSTGTEIEVKKNTKRIGAIWSKGEPKEKDRATADRLSTIQRLISKKFQDQDHKAERLSIDRAIRADRLAKLYEFSQRERRSIAAYEPINRAPNEGRDSVIADRSAKPPEA